MTDYKRRAAELEAKAEDSALIALLATNPEVKSYNRQLAEHLRRIADQIRAVHAYDATLLPSRNGVVRQQEKARKRKWHYDILVKDICS